MRGPIEELFKIQDHGAGLKSQYVRKLEIDTPIDFSCSTSVEGFLPGAGAVSEWMISFRSLFLHSCVG